MAKKHLHIPIEESLHLSVQEHQRRCGIRAMGRIVSATLQIYRMVLRNSHEGNVERNLISLIVRIYELGDEFSQDTTDEPRCHQDQLCQETQLVLPHTDP
jgi:hypothetical protein